MSTMPFLGEIDIYPYVFAPRYFTWCDGQTLPINQNPALYSIISDYYGGDGRNTMGVPNLKGRTPMNFGTSPGLSPRSLGEVTGTANVTLAPDDLPTHSHSLTALREGGPSDDQGPQFTLGLAQYSHTDGNIYPVRTYKTDPSSFSEKLADQTITTSGGSGSHENRQPYLALRFCLCIDGVYPTRN
ncbi:MAG: phage tail protein [Rhodospirillaceae bacterium]